MTRLALVLIGGAAGLLQGNQAMMEMLKGFDVNAMEEHMSTMQKHMEDVQKYMTEHPEVQTDLENSMKDVLAGFNPEAMKETLSAFMKAKDEAKAAPAAEAAAPALPDLSKIMEHVPKELMDKFTDVQKDMGAVMQDLQGLMSDALESVGGMEGMQEIIKKAQEGENTEELVEVIKKVVMTVVEKLDLPEAEKEKAERLITKAVSEAESLKEKFMAKAAECQQKPGVPQCSEEDQECVQGQLLDSLKCYADGVFDGEENKDVAALMKQFTGAFFQKPSTEQKEKTREQKGLLSKKKMDGTVRARKFADARKEIELGME